MLLILFSLVSTFFIPHSIFPNHLDNYLSTLYALSTPRYVGSWGKGEDKGKVEGGIHAGGSEGLDDTAHKLRVAVLCSAASVCMPACLYSLSRSQADEEISFVHPRTSVAGVISVPLLPVTFPCGSVRHKMRPASEFATARCAPSSSCKQ